MPSVSSRPRGLLAGLVGLQLGLAFDLGLTPQPARSDLRWARGVFPIVHFAGYTSHFGRRTGPGGGREMHSGLDIAAPLGSPIRNWWAGTVADVFHDGSCGVGVVIRSGDYEHMYCHLAGAAHGGTYASGPVLLRPGQTGAGWPADRSCGPERPYHGPPPALGNPLPGHLARSGPDSPGHGARPAVAATVPATVLPRSEVSSYADGLRYVCCPPP